MIFMMALFYLFIPLFILYLVLVRFLGRIKARTTFFLIVAACFLYVWCFITGLLFSFFFEPESYWHSMNINMDYWNAFGLPSDADHLGHIFKMPYIAADQALRISFYILRTHFNWSFGLSFAAGGIIYYGWCLGAFYARRIRDPMFGFGEGMTEAAVEREKQKFLKECKARGTI